MSADWKKPFLISFVTVEKDSSLQMYQVEWSTRSAIWFNRNIIEILNCKKE